MVREPEPAVDTEAGETDDTVGVLAAAYVKAAASVLCTASPRRDGAADTGAATATRTAATWAVPGGSGGDTHTIAVEVADQTAHGSFIARTGSPAHEAPAVATTPPVPSLAKVVHVMFGGSAPAGASTCRSTVFSAASDENPEPVTVSTVPPAVEPMAGETPVTASG
jgi:hypothetical protein